MARWPVCPRRSHAVKGRLVGELRRRHWRTPGERNVSIDNIARIAKGLLVFLHLLECDAERISKLCLAHPKHQTAHADPAAHMLVYWVEGFFCHAPPAVHSRCRTNSTPCMVVSVKARSERWSSLKSIKPGQPQCLRQPPLIKSFNVHPITPIAAVMIVNQVMSLMYRSGCLRRCRK